MNVLSVTSKAEYLRAHLSVTAFDKEDVIVTSAPDDPNMPKIIIPDD